MTLTIGADGSKNVINVYYTKRTDLSYTVEYREAGTDKVLKAAKTENGQTFGASVTETAEKIDGYTVTGESSKSLTIQADEKENKIIFYYTKRGDLAYVVNYLEKGTDKVLHKAKTADNQTFDAEITASAEKINIDGYNYDSVDPETLKITTDNSKNVINVYYTKRTDLSYTVNYLEKGTNAALHEAKTVENVTFATEITTANEAIPIDGYNYDSAEPAEKLVVGTGENVINVYYTKKTDLSYTVNYLEKDTNKVLHDAKVQGGMTFASTVNSANEVIEIHGYRYESADPEELLINTQRNVMNLYYLPDSDQTVHITYKSMNTNAGKVTNEADDIQIVTADGLKGSVANANKGYAFAGWYKGTELVSSATNLDITTAKAHLNKAEDGTYVATEFVAHWKGLEVTKVVDSIVDKDGNKQKLDEAVSLNDTITYKITVKNIGTVDLTDIEVSDELAYAQLVSGSSWTIQSLAAGTTSDPIYVTYTVKETDLGKTLKNVATATVPKDPEVPVKPGETTNETDDVKPSLAAKKTIVSTQESYGVDDKVLFNITVTNNGNVTLTNVIVSELLSGAEIVEGTGYDPTNEGTAKITTLAPGEVVTVNASYVVRQDDVDNGNLKNIALVEGEGPDGNNPEPQRPEKDVPMNEKNPQMTAVKSVTNQGTAENGKFKVGETAEFEIAVTNRGNVTLKNVTVTENLENAIIDEDPANYKVANNVATIESILPGKTTIVKAYYVVAQEDIDRGTLNNIATVTAPGTDPKTPSEPVPMEDQKSSYTVVKTLTNLEEATGTRTAEDGTETKAFKEGEKAKFNITVKNTGNVTLSDIEVKDILAGAVLTADKGYELTEAGTAKITALAPEAEVVIKAEYVVTQTDVDNGGTQNTVTATGKNPGETPVDSDPIKPEPIPTEDQEPSYTVVKTLSNQNEATGTKTVNGQTVKAFKVGEKAKFDIVVTNTGNVTLNDIVVTEGLADAKIVSGNGYTVVDGKAVIDKLSVGTDNAVTVKAEYEITQEDVENGEITNTVTATGKNPGETTVDPDPIDPEPIPTEDKNPAIKITKVVSNTSADPEGYAEGEKIEYTIQAENIGNITLDNVVITDEMTGDKWEVGTLTPQNPFSEEYKTSYEVKQSDILIGTVTNTAEVQGTSRVAEERVEERQADLKELSVEPIKLTDNAADYTVQDSATVVSQTVKKSSALQVTKTVTSKGSTITVDGKDVTGYRVGDTIEYNIHVKNTGNLTLTNVVVNDVPTLATGSPNGSIVIAPSTDNTYTVDGSKATIATLTPGAEVDIKASYLVMAGDGTLKGNKLSNAAFVTGTSPDKDNPQPGDSSKTDPAPIEPEPDEGNGAMEGSITVTKMITTSDGKTPKDGVDAVIKVGLYDNASFSGQPIKTNTITISRGTSGNTVFDELDNTAGTVYYVAELDENGKPIVGGSAHLKGYGVPSYSANCKAGINPTTTKDTAASIVNPLAADSTGNGDKNDNSNSSTTSNNSNTSTSTKAAKTGDNTNMMLYWMLLGMAILAGCVAVVYRKRKER